jgi:ribosomal protein S18 acetylase RimI-like enzyme
MEPQIVRPAREDFRCIARLHSESITEGFLSTLGLPFLSNLYRGISAAPQSGLLVARDADRVLGFAAFTADLTACYRWVLTRRFIPLGISLLPNLLNLSLYRKIMQTLAYPLRAAREASEAGSAQPRAELLAISVGDQARGRGIGKILLRAVDERFAQLRVAQYFVVTHGIDERSNSFYKACGFHWVRSFTNHGKPMNEYVRILRPSSVVR